MADTLIVLPKLQTKKQLMVDFTDHQLLFELPLIFPLTRIWPQWQNVVEIGHRFAHLEEVLLDRQKVGILFKCRNLVASFCVPPEIWEVLKPLLVKFVLEVVNEIKPN